MAEILDDGEFWLPPQFLSDNEEDEFVKNRNGFGFEADANAATKKENVFAGLTQQSTFKEGEWMVGFNNNKMWFPHKTKPDVEQQRRMVEQKRNVWSHCASSGIGMRAGTGVFLPLRRSKAAGCSVFVPARVVKALNLSLDRMCPQPQPSLLISASRQSSRLHLLTKTFDNKERFI